MTDHVTTTAEAAAAFSGGRGSHEYVSPAEAAPWSDAEVAEFRRRVMQHPPVSPPVARLLAMLKARAA